MASTGYSGIAADGRQQLLVTGIPGGVIEVVGESSAWQYMGLSTDSWSGQSYRVYNSGSNAQLLIDTDLTRLGAVI